jgi:hypothetical protein
MGLHVFKRSASPTTSRSGLDILLMGIASWESPSIQCPICGAGTNFVTASQVGRLMGVVPRMITEWCKEGKFPGAEVIKGISELQKVFGESQQYPFSNSSESERKGRLIRRGVG